MGCEVHIYLLIIQYVSKFVNERYLVLILNCVENLFYSIILLLSLKIHFGKPTQSFYVVIGKYIYFPIRTLNDWISNRVWYGAIINSVVLHKKGVKLIVCKAAFKIRHNFREWVVSGWLGWVVCGWRMGDSLRAAFRVYVYIYIYTT